MRTPDPASDLKSETTRSSHSFQVVPVLAECCSHTSAAIISHELVAAMGTTAGLASALVLIIIVVPLLRRRGSH